MQAIGKKPDGHPGEPEPAMQDSEMDSGSTLLPMLIGGLLLVIAGMISVVIFV